MIDDIDTLEDNGEEAETSDTKQSKPWLFKKGQSGNPMGRPPGRSLKDRAKAYLSGLTDDEAVEFFEGMNKKDVWEMAEGKAKQDVDTKLSGQLIISIAPEVVAKNDLHATNTSTINDSKG